MVKSIFIVTFGFFLIILLGIILYSFYQYYTLFNSLFIKLVFGLILGFTTLVVLRYMFLLFFSILQTIKKSAEETYIIDYTKKMPKISVIVPAYNEEVTIATSLASLLKQTYPNFEILVIDDGSQDRTSLIAKRFEFENQKKSLKVYRKKNGGKSRAINYGIKRATGELIFVMDADSKLSPNALYLLARHFEDPDTAAVAGSVYVSNRNNILTKLQALEYIEGLNMVRNGQAFLKAVNIIPGPIGMFRKSALEDVGLYDHDTFAEDCDVTLKLITKGYKIDFEPEALAYTEAPENLLDLIKQRYRWTRGILQAIKKHSKLLWNFHINKTASFVMWYMIFESIIWPVADVYVNIFVVYQSLVLGMSMFVFYWWSIFTILDMAGALYCVLITGESLSLVFYALYYRLFFIEIINIAKILSSLEEFFGVQMSWGKLERKGSL